ncbi:hypothetical protein ACHAW6_006551 [Cyclotella cf. meneghiniana]
MSVTDSQNQVPNPLRLVNASGGTACNSAQSSFFGSLFNQLMFFNNITDTSSSTSANANQVNMMSGSKNNSVNNSMMNACPTENSTTPLSQICSVNQSGENHFIQQSQPMSPMLMSFMTPRMSLTPNPPTNPPTPLMTPRMGLTPDPLSDSPAHPLGSLNEMLAKKDASFNEIARQKELQNSLVFQHRSSPAAGSSLNQKTAVDSTHRTKWDKTESVNDTTKATSASATANAQTSLFRRGITSVGSALGVVANYINESLLSGIPFHLADRAMRESKETYAKWWEGGINNGNIGGYDEEENANGKCDDDNTEAAGNVDRTGQDPAEKRRKIGSGEALDIYTQNKGSALSASLEKNYNSMGIGTKRHDEPREIPVRSYDNSSSNADVLPMEVDSSIIKRRRSQFNHSCEHSEQDYSGLEGYDIFNNVGCMYGNDITRGENKDVIKVASTAYDSNNSSTISSAKQTTTIITSSSAIDGTMNAIKELFEEKNNAQDENEIYHMITSPRTWVTRTLRSELIDALQSAHGDTKDKRFLSSLEVLSRFFKSSGRDARVNPWSVRKISDGGSEYGYSGSEVGGPLASDLLEGSWVNMSRPNYVECLGKNREGDFMYTLGRMSFDMFQPGDLICSVQSTHNNIRIVGEQEELPSFVPKSLREEVASLSNSDGDSTSKRPLLRSYDIAVSMTIEPPTSVGQPEPLGSPTPTKRLRAIIAVKGYVLPDPHTPNRLTVWFTGGKLCPAKLASNDDEDSDDEEEDNTRKHKSNSKKQPVKKEAEEEDEEYGGFEEWADLFSKGKWRKTLGERARAMAAKLLLGAEIPNKMEDDGKMEYALHRPGNQQLSMGGHSKVYVDVMYLDEDILIMRGHHGTIYAMARSCVSQRYRDLHR